VPSSFRFRKIGASCHRSVAGEVDLSEVETIIHALPGSGRPFPVDDRLARLVDAVRAAGGRPIAVGGSVRDHLLGTPPKDVDVEVHGVPLDDLERALAARFRVEAVGRSFGVLKVVVEQDTFDVSLPRRENKVGRGHRGFVVENDPAMGFDAAALRRDFTLNAMGVDLADGALLDPHGGVADLARGVLRHVSPAFDEDPLRVLRAAQFAARFGLSIADDTLARCRNLVDELATLPRERLWEETKKLLVKARWPSIGLAAWRTTGALALFPELAAMIGCPQEPEWHPEGDVWVHTLMVVDEAASLAREEQLDEDETLIVVLGALCHDLGKPPTTAFSDGRIRSIEHESQGEAPTRSFLARVGAPPAVVEAIVPLVKDHLKPYQLYRDKERVSDGALRRLALRVPIRRLVRVAAADHRGRTTADALQGGDPAGAWLLDEAARLDVAAQAPSPILMGRHLLERGWQPGKAMGEALKQAFEAQLEGRFDDVDGALRWLAESGPKP
jgi:tRNA nucleotidyltransferase (CCA-adding enzyme)